MNRQSKKSTSKSASKKSTTNRKANTKAQKAAVARHRLDPQMKIVPAVKANPRRKGSHGYKSLQVILNARKGITVEQFTAKGGRLRDLHWDVQNGNAKLSKAS